MKIKALNCPNCGAAVSSDSPQCKYCKSRLKTKACPECFATMFEGSQFCPHCGASTVKLKPDSDAKVGKCPRCSKELMRIEVSETALRECENCGGIWSDIKTFENICAEKERQAVVIDMLAAHSASVKPEKIKYVPCPDCGELMNRSNYARASGVIIDICKRHGVWFDAEELPAIINFINDGGLDRARQKEKAQLDERFREIRRLELERTRDLDRFAKVEGYSDTSPLSSIVRFLLK